MKKFIFALSFICGLVFMANAQKLYKSHIHVGVKGGATLSSMSFSPGVEQSMTQGFTGGLVFRYAEERHVGLLAELNIVQRGWEESFEDGEPFEYKRTLTYIQLPLMTHIFFGSQRFKGFINLGPEISYMIGNSIKSNFDYNNVSSIPDFPLQYRMTEQMGMDIENKFDYGITAGLGMEFKFNRKHSIALEGRYYFGLGNIFPSSKKDVFDASRHSSIMVTLGYYYRIK
ncbi:MAG: PorT family protein [Muribaculaceae bacterium]|nr:PorT family protein [Muribaculaceae bacterium]MBR3765613.1 PorT family protein [Muribaculaceae bacterium]